MHKPGHKSGQKGGIVMWKWYIHFYRRYNLVDEAWIWADTKQEALQKLRQTTPALEIICCIKQK